MRKRLFDENHPEYGLNRYNDILGQNGIEWELTYLETKFFKKLTKTFINSADTLRSFDLSEDTHFVYLFLLTKKRMEYIIVLNRTMTGGRYNAILGHA